LKNKKALLESVSSRRGEVNRTLESKKDSASELLLKKVHLSVAFHYARSARKNKSGKKQKTRQKLCLISRKGDKLAGGKQGSSKKGVWESSQSRKNT